MRKEFYRKESEGMAGRIARNAEKFSHDGKVHPRSALYEAIEFEQDHFVDNYQTELDEARPGWGQNVELAQGLEKLQGLLRKAFTVIKATSPDDPVFKNGKKVR